MLCCTSPGGDFPSYPLHELLDLPPERARIAAHRDQRQPPRRRLAGRAPRGVRRTSPRAYAGGYADEEDERRHRRLLAARSRLDTIDRLPSIASPTLIAGGHFDGIAPLRNQELLHERIPGSRLELFEGGHGFMREDPRALEVIVDWLTA